MVPVGYLTTELGFPVASQRLGNGVQVDHHLHGVAGAFVAGFGVDDDAVIFAVGDDVGPAGQSRRFTAEFKPVLSLDVDVVAADFPVGSALVEQRSVVEQPLCLLKSDVTFAQSWWCALNQMAHSQEFSPVSRRGSQVAQM